LFIALKINGRSRSSKSKVIEPSLLKSNLDSSRRVWHRWIDATVAGQNPFFQFAAAPRMKREFAILLGGWLLLAAFIFGMGRENLSSPGLFYDEAVYAGLTKDFVTGQTVGGHMPGVSTAEIFGAPFPVFVQPYIGALKCWLLIPIFKIFGSTLAVLRASNLFFCAIALFIFMLWTWRLLGLVEALLAGLLLAFDPSFFFLGVLDWGSLLPSLLCRFAGFFLVLLAWRRPQARWMLFAGLALGLGFFNKIDFGVLLAGTALAAACVYANSIIEIFRRRPKIFLPALLGFLVGAGPVMALFRVIFHSVFSKNAPHNPGELAEKLHTLRAMYDGSYFYRLMDTGGLFDKMYQAPSPVWTPFGIIFLAAVLILTADVVFSAKENLARRTRIFLLLSAAFVTPGVLILPGAVRIHHTTLVYPFPHLIIAAATMSLWHHRWKNFPLQRATRGLLVACLLFLVVGEFHAVIRTQKLIRETGGRGWWSNALVKFAGETKGKSNLVISSLDWGFNEQLEFLTDGPHLEEPFWQAAFGGQPDLPRDTNHIYLAHPPEFALSPLGAQFIASVARENKNVVVQPWRDGQGTIVFYVISFPTP
jgi:Dolichyl-phosphate-mannose-protein mannosyltransferase